MACVINTLLADGKCFAALPNLNLVLGPLWCAFEGGGPPPGAPGGWFNPDSGSVISNPDSGSGTIVNPEVP